MLNKIRIEKYDKQATELSNLLNIKLINLECKHIPELTEKNIKLLIDSEKVNYQYLVFGSHREHCRLSDELNRIENMSHSSCQRAVRIVLTNDNKVWCDNTHWTIAYIHKFGKETTLNCIPFYIVDLRFDYPVIIDYDNTLFDSLSNIMNAIAAAMQIQDRIDRGWRNNINYTIGDFLNTLNKGNRKEYE